MQAHKTIVSYGLLFTQLRQNLTNIFFFETIVLWLCMLSSCFLWNKCKRDIVYVGSYEFVFHLKHWDKTTIVLIQLCHLLYFLDFKGNIRWINLILFFLLCSWGQFLKGHLPSLSFIRICVSFGSITTESPGINNCKSFCITTLIQNSPTWSELEDNLTLSLEVLPMILNNICQPSEFIWLCYCFWTIITFYY